MERHAKPNTRNAIYDAAAADGAPACRTHQVSGTPAHLAAITAVTTEATCASALALARIATAGPGILVPLCRRPPQAR